MTSNPVGEGWLCDHGYWQHGQSNMGSICTHYTTWPMFPTTTTAYLEAPAQLGILQEMWDAWDPVIDHTMSLRAEDFFGLLATQAGEIDSHLYNDMTDKAINEVVDIISIALNWLRNLGAGTPDEVAAVIQTRIRDRYKGRVFDIIARDFPKQFGAHDA